MGFYVALASSLVLSKTLDSEVLFYCKEGVEFLLGHIDLPMLNEVEHRLEVSVLNTFQVKEMVLVRVAL